MANLPDLDTSAIGIIAFWNATQHGVSSIDPTEVLSDPDIASYTQYDNGVEGTYHLSTGDGGYIEVNFRVKGDGWFITWFPRLTVPETDEIDIDAPWSTNASDPSGYFNMLWDWTKNNENISPTQSALERAIHNLASHLSNWGAITYSESDVGYYCYHFTDATGIYQDSEQESASAYNPGPFSFNGGISYTSGVSIYYARAVAVVYHAPAGGKRTYWKAAFEGKTILSEANTTSVYGSTEGSVDISNLLASSGVYYKNNGYIKLDSGYVGTACRGKISHLVIWG